MKGKDIISAAVGSSFFAIPYLALATPIAPALVIGASAFAATELVLSSFKKKETLKDTNISLYEKINNAKKDNKKILDLIPKIDDESVRKSLSEINSTVDKIIKEIAKNPKKVSNIKNFFEYYLPVLVKIVDRYDEIENQGLVSSEGMSFMKKANVMIKDTNESFKTILSSLYQKDIMDTDAEMKIYNMMMKADGIVPDELTKKGRKNDE